MVLEQIIVGVSVGVVVSGVVGFSSYLIKNKIKETDRKIDGIRDKVNKLERKVDGEKEQRKEEHDTVIKWLIEISNSIDGGDSEMIPDDVGTSYKIEEEDE